MYFQFLVEDLSGSELIDQVMKKVQVCFPHIEYDCKSFHGIGKLPEGSNVREIKTGQILNDLAIYLRGFDRSLRCISSAMIIVIDNDDRKTDEFLSQLKHVAEENNIQTDYVFCIAVEELEAWLLGDEDAIIQAYPEARIQMLKNYEQDSICGTWEHLADIVYKGGLNQLKKDCSCYADLGKRKCEWAKEIGKHLDLDRNQSPSFRYMIEAIFTRARTA